MFRSRALLLVCSFALGIPASAQAQDVPLARILVDFFTEAVRMTSGTGSPGNPHEVHFLPGLSQQAAPFELQKALVTQLSTFPLGTSSGGFTYTLDPATGAITPASPSFGPSFAERALTIGRGKVNAGVQYQHVAYDSFEDVPLEGEQIAFILQHNDCCPAGANNPPAAGNTLPFFEGDLVETRLSLNVKPIRPLRSRTWVSRTIWKSALPSRSFARTSKSAAVPPSFGSRPRIRHRRSFIVGMGPAQR